MMIRIKTDFPDAIDSPDYIVPLGAKENNCSSEEFISELHRMAREHINASSEKFSYLDLGCAGGQAVIDLYKLGYISCGVEGSNLDVMLNPEIAKNGVDYNWKTYKDICLFKADITKPFEMLNDNNELQKFDIVAAWDVLEHPKTKDIPNVILNIKKHMHENSIFIAIIGITTSGPYMGFEHHQCIESHEWWLDIFDKYDMYNIGFTMNASPRSIPAININEIGFILKKKIILWEI